MTLFIAIWGVILGTVTLIWNIVRWRQEKPRITATVEALESFWSENNFRGIRLTIRNRGGKRTTIEQVFFYERTPWFKYGFESVLERLGKEIEWQQNVGVANQKTVKLPVVLDVNEMWEGFVQLETNEPDNEDELRQVENNHRLLGPLKSGNLRFSIQCSHTKRRVRGLIRGEEDSLKE